MDQTKFERIPGTGYMFYRTSQPDVQTKREIKRGTEHRFAVWSGWIAFPGGKELQVRALASTRAQEYSLALHEFPESTETPEAAWSKVAEFTLPAFGEFNYVEGECVLDKRTYKVRMFKTPEGYIRLRLPQVMNAKQANAAMI